MSTNNPTPIVFTGKGGEYFGIWIVNLLLSIVTLGIYSAWAKVRRKKYFYQNTLIDGVGFDYHANPIAILKGRLIAVAFFILYNVLASINPILALILALLLFIAIPWIVVRGLTFNARNSSHRGLRFDFDGKYGQAALVFIGYAFLIVVTLGLAMPFVMQRTNKFVFDHHKFGASHFEMNALVKDFYMVYLKLLGVVLAIGVIGAVGIKSLTSSYLPGAHTSMAPAHNSYAQSSHNTSTEGFIKVANVDESTTADTQESADAEAYATEEADLAAEEPSSESDYLESLTPEERAEFEAQMKALEEQMQQGAPAQPSNPLDKVFGPYIAMFGIWFFIGIFAFVFLYVLVLLSITAYVQSRVHNLVWNNTRLDHVGFSCHQRMRDLIWLYFSNMLLLMFTLGLATPWAQIRMARYRLTRLALTGETNWDQFVGEKKEASRAMGEEIAEMFDVDLSFG